MAQKRPPQNGNDRGGGWAYPDGSKQPYKDDRQQRNQPRPADQGRTGGNQSPNRRPQHPNPNQPRPNNGYPSNGQQRNPYRSGNGMPMTVSERRREQSRPIHNPVTGEVERRRREQKRYNAEKRQNLFQTFMAYLVLFLIAFFSLALIVVLLFVWNFTKVDNNAPSAVKYNIGEKGSAENGVTENIKAETAISDSGTLYVNFSAAAEYFGMSVTGDNDRLNYIITDKTNERSFDTITAKAEAEEAVKAQRLSDAIAAGQTPVEEVTDEGVPVDEATETEDEQDAADEHIPPTDSAGTGNEEVISFEINSNRAWVNGQEIRLASYSVMRDKNLWVDAGFITAYMTGVTLVVNDKQTDVTVTKKLIPKADGSKYKDGEARVYEYITLNLKKAEPLKSISEDIFTLPAVDFLTDLSAYEEYMNPADRDAYLDLINYRTLLTADYVPPDLVPIANTRNDGRSVQQMREYAAKALEAMFIEMNANNIWNVSVTSGYRDYAYQENLFNQKVAEFSSLPSDEAREKAATIVAVPGTSEHQSGLSCDMHNLASADISFAETGAYEWMSQNAHKFGFIVRFPEDKVDITKISFEPWHYRYVGRYHASRIYDLKVSLEEYVETLK